MWQSERVHPVFRPAAGMVLAFLALAALAPGRTRTDVNPQQDIETFWFLRLQRFRFSPTSPAAVVQSFYLPEGETLRLYLTATGLVGVPPARPPRREPDLVLAYRDRRFWVVRVSDRARLERLDQWDARTAKTVWSPFPVPGELASGTLRLGPWPLHFSYQPPYGRVLVFQRLDQRPTPLKAFDRFPVDLRYRVVASLDPEAGEKQAWIETTRGLQTPMKQVGWLHFELMGQSLKLRAFLEEGEDPSTLFVLFRDATTGKETYSVGRYVEATRLRDRTYLLDFNKAYLPLCAYSPHYNCPIPPPENHLPVAIRAGERWNPLHGRKPAPPHGTAAGPEQW